MQPKVVVAAAAGVDEVEEEDAGPAEANFDYLLSMPIQSLTLEKARHSMSCRNLQKLIILSSLRL